MMKLTFLGDVMCKAQMVESFAENGHYDFSSIFESVKDLFESSDYVFANLETPISYDNSGLTNEKYCFNSPLEFAEAVHDAGINFVATANNHCLDRGIKGVISTVNALDKTGLIHTGIFSEKNRILPTIINVKNLKLGILSYTYGTNAFSNNNYLKSHERWHVNLFQNQELSCKITRWCYYHKTNLLAKVYNKLSEIVRPGQISRPVYERKERDSYCRKKIKKDIDYLKNNNVDLIVFYMHAGGQYNQAPTAYTKELTDWLLKTGVNIVVGSHEHVVHGGVFDNINKNQIATYSLGNFDGVAGVYEPPFEKKAEYTVAWNVYINDSKKLEKTSFTILKTIPEKNGKISVQVCYDLLHNGQIDDLEKNKILNDMSIISKTFSGKTIEPEHLKNNRELYV